MPNDYYNVHREPLPRQRARAEVVASELRSIERGLDGLPSKNALFGGLPLVASETDVSGANAYVLASDYPITEFVIGLTVRCFFTHTNTAASTVNVDGTGVKDLVNLDGSDLQGQEIVATWMHELVYDGTRWRLQNSAKRVSASLVLNSSLPPQNFQRNTEIADLELPTASGGSAPYTYAATGLPAGLSFAAATRIISGTPTTIGSSIITYTVTDANSQSFEFQFSIRIVAQVLILPDPADRLLQVGSSYSFTLAPATGGTAPYTYTLFGLPPGMAFDQELREVAGVPTMPAVYNLILTARDSGDPSQTVAQQFVLTISSASDLSIPTVADRDFVPGASITPITLPAATGGVPDYTYIVTGLGEGLMFDPEARQITGTPSAQGERNVTYRVQDAIGTQVERQFVINIQPVGARYITVSEDRTISATDLQGGNSYAPAAEELTLPTWLGNRYIVIAQPAELDDFTSISLAGLGNSISDFEKQSYVRTIAGIEYEVWISLEVQGSVISGEVIEVRP